MVYQKIGQHKYPAKEVSGVKRGRRSHCNRNQTRRPNINQSTDEIDWSSDDLSHVKLKQLRVFFTMQPKEVRE